ncbi:nodulation protein NfeD [Solitalea sp. MAHUQ-68]|uniref:Nodulation protein NfeD n=1 Tax=Solitalea agri TaxID=2953739 RepID=A0A9X2JDS5_9SPHI|nr:NfeD family protein [Solitalea agri]MCO4294787.1 nodulation protein NfeD [Solitalea agri]
MIIRIYFLLILFFLISISLLAQTPGKQKVYQFRIGEEIAPAAWRKTKQAYAEAEKLNANLVVIDMNTYGGMLDMADSIRTKILESPIKTVVFINNNAASAGALIAIACDKIYMRNAASIGAASVVNQSGEIMPEKYQSYMRSLMRATAEANGRDPKIAEAFVDSNTIIEGVKTKGTVLTFTTSEAIEHKYCDGKAESIYEVLKQENVSDYQIIKQQQTWVDHVIDFLTKPAISGVLILLIIAGIYFELQAPGIGFALGVAVVAALLFFAPLYLQGLAANWEILLFVVGILLLLAEILVIPGFGVAGILGIIFIICGLTFSLVANNRFDFSLSGGKLMSSFIIVIVSIIGSIILALVFGKNLFNSRLFQHAILKDEQKASEGYISSIQKINLTGQTGIALTDLRPAGKILIENDRYDALSDGEFIIKGTKVVVIKHETISIFVRKST